MKIALSHYVNGVWDACDRNTLIADKDAQLTLVFADRKLLEDTAFCDELLERFNSSSLVFCSTSGEIYQDTVTDLSAVVTGLSFEKTDISIVSVSLQEYANSQAAGVAIAQQLVSDQLRYVLVFSDGGVVNGADLIQGMNTVISAEILITGGLAGDADRFERTLVGLNERPESGKIVAIGFSGDALQIGHGSMGGWETFGPERVITKSDANTLYEIDGTNGLDLYSRYLGDYADQLPSSALLFPLSLEIDPEHAPVVRTILSVDFEAKSMLFAGNVPEGGKVRLMRANFDKLIDAAGEAAEKSLDSIKRTMSPDFALLISCVGRKLILKHRIEEEVEAVRAVFPESTLVSGFYSYGELSPLVQQGTCELHNQTMTITTFKELL